MRLQVRSLLAAVACILLVSAVSPRARAQDEPASPTLAAIDAAEARGEISAGQAMLTRLQYFHGSTQVLKSLMPSPPVQPQATGGSPVRCATSIMMEAKEKLSGYPLSVQGDISDLLQRPTLDSYIDTPHFRIHYSTHGQNMVYGWPNTAYRDSVAAAAEKCWTFDHVTKNWRVPPSDGTKGGGDNLIDVYLDDLGTSAYGYTVPEDPVAGPWPNAHTAFFVVDNDYQGFGYTDRTLPMKVTVAHEYHHVVQIGYTIDNRWWMENLSTFMESEIYDGVNDNYQYIGCYTSQPYRNQSTTNGCFEYGCFLWPTFIAEKWDHSLTEQIQTCAATGNIFQCFNSVFGALGSDYASALAEWGLWNFYTYQRAYRDGGPQYREGSQYRYYMAFDQEFSSFPVNGAHPTPGKMPEASGTSVQRFQRDPFSHDNKLTVRYAGPSCTRQVVVVAKESGHPVFHEYYMNLDANGGGSVDVPDWDTCEFAHMIVALPQSCGSGSFDYSFGATTTISTGVSDNPPLYTRTVELDQNVPNPFGPETRIAYRMAQDGPIELAVFDAGGRRVRTLIHARQSAGEYSVRWDGRDDAGIPTPTGVYFYRLSSSGASQVRKLIISR